MTEPQTAAPPERFDTLPLDAKLLRAVADQGYATMTPIQAKAIPIVLAGRDVMGAAQTGTGKTAAFSIPLLQRMLKHETASVSPARHPVRALVIAPTRELADQVANNVKAYSKHTMLRAACVFGGVDMKPQTLELKAGVEVLIATPGRLLDHIEAKNCVLNQVEYVVLDEADRMLDIGFLPDLQRILSYLPKTRQTLLFSATFSPEIKRLAQSYLQEPVLVEVARPNATASTVEQLFYSVTDDDKRSVIKKILKEREIRQAIVGRAGASGIAITLVTRADARNIADVEKLIKRKIELDAIEVEEERPRRPRREFEPRERSSDEGRRDEGRRDEAPRPSYRAPAPAPRDPFFDKPYESKADGEAAAWEKGAAAAPTTARGLSSNIKPKKKVAALFGAKPPAPVEG
jgi:superfamily II DNA/RNA helicase